MEPRYHSLTLKIENGFTLIELSIVLVIIGLIVGGVLVGRDLIHAAEIRATIKQFEQFNVAAQAFKLKFNCLPGDCRDVAAFGFDPASAGNGDEKIGQRWFQDGTWSDDQLKVEHYNFWYHLSVASMIPGYFGVTVPADLPSLYFGGMYVGLGVKTPPAKIPLAVHTFSSHPGGWWVENDVQFDASAGGGFMVGHSFLLAPMSVLPNPAAADSTDGYGGYFPRDAWAIDSKIDDAQPISGNTRVWTGIVFTFTEKKYRIPSGDAFPDCVVTVGGVTSYNYTYAGTLASAMCNLSIRASF